jgi:hypothetical protein
LVLITNRYEENFADLVTIGVQFIGTTSVWSPTTGKLATLAKKAILSGLLLATGIERFRKVAPEIVAAVPALIETWHHPQIVRWFAIERFLDLNRGYRQVFLADVRDVIFQAPLFEPSFDRVSLFDSDEIYGTSDCDTQWYRDAWGEAALAKVIGKRIVCMGTVLGPHSQLLSIVREFRIFLRGHLSTGIDQSLFNYMLQGDLIRTPYRVVENVRGQVATLSNDRAHKSTVTHSGFIRRAIDDSIIPVVHMYDRWPDTKAAYMTALTLNRIPQWSQSGPCPS